MAIGGGFGASARRIRVAIEQATWAGGWCRPYAIDERD